MSVRPESPSEAVAPTPSAIRRRGIELGLAAVGFTTADVLEPARTVLQLRRLRRLNGEMQFTYRNPIRSTDPQQRMPSARSLVVTALGYGSSPPTQSAACADDWQDTGEESDPSADPLAGAGRLARYVWSDYYGRLGAILDELADNLIEAGFRAQVLIDSNHLVDRNVAWRAGLGWYGKNANLLLPGTGSWYVLGSILTDASLEPTAAPMADGCGPCQRCIDECPTKAIVAPGIVDARRCIAWLVQAGEPIPIEFRGAVGDRIYGCDDCQEVCPPNKSQAANTEAIELRADLGWILSADDAAILERHGQWYIADRNVDVIRRTALVALGNSAEPSWGARRVTGLLRRYLSAGNPLLRNHAVWAARRLGVGWPDPQPGRLQAPLDAVGEVEVELPACCGTGDGECRDPDLHHELSAPVVARFSLEEWRQSGEGTTNI